MNNVIQILNTVLPVALMLGIGMICRRKHVFTREGIDALKRMVVNITLPMVLLSAYATMEYSGKNIVLTLLIYGICALAWLMGKILGRVLHMESQFIPFLTTGFEAGMLGYSLFILLYGAEKVGGFASIDLGQGLFVFTLYKFLLGMNGKEHVSVKKLAVEMVQSPTMIAILLGVVLGATGIYQAMIPSGLNSVFDACMTFVGAPTSAVILLSIGYDLVFDNTPWLAVGKLVGLRIVIMLILRFFAGAVVRALGFGDSLDQALNIMFILPPPYVLPVFADDEEQRSYLSSAISVMTLLTILGFVVLAIKN